MSSSSEHEEFTDRIHLMMKKAIEKYKKNRRSSRTNRDFQRRKFHKRRHSSSTSLWSDESSVDSSNADLVNEEPPQRNTLLPSNAINASAPPKVTQRSNESSIPSSVDLSATDPLLARAALPQVPEELKNLNKLHVMTQVQTQVCSAISANSTALGSLMNVTKGPLTVMNFITDAKAKMNDAIKHLLDLQDTLIKFRQVYDIQNIKKNSPATEHLAEASVNDSSTEKMNTSEEEKVLKYLEIVAGNNFILPQSELARKLAFLLHYESRRGIETVGKIKLSNIDTFDDCINVKIPDEGVTFQVKKYENNPNLCVIEVLKVYLAQTRQGRGNEDHLFLKNKKRGNHYPPAPAKLITGWIDQLRVESQAWKTRGCKDTKKRRSCRQ